ncbi:MAG: UDP-glucose 4-epimerase GalE [Sedimentisphaerales bacterium]|jgi:UDP-glucose 4-epimerase|nr:UDP-glucose 4-epimerase GalE [Sedimentisphaerales bacterium]
MRILVCGGAGYIGSNMVHVLKAAGHEPIVLDNLSKGHRAAIGDTPFVQGDLAAHDLLVRTLKGYKIEAVMHFAAFIEVCESMREALVYYRNNVCNTQVLLSAMEAVGVERFVFSSTAAVYGMPIRIPITEDMPTQPINPYGQTKLAVEQMCHWQAQTGRLRYAALRYFNACGAGAGGRLGEDHRPESHLIPLVIKAAMGRLSEVKVYGTDYPTPDGTCIRDFIHVEDLCTAHLLALERLEKEPELVYNLGNGAGYSVGQVIETVKQVSGRDFKVCYAQRRPGDPPVLTSDASKARRELNWQIRFPDLRAMVESAWEFHNRFPDGYPD